MTLKKGYKQLLEDAEKRAPGISVDDARKSHGDPDTVFVDIRDVRELEREGMIPGAFHAPRGMLEFYDAASKDGWGGRDIATLPAWWVEKGK